MLDTEITKLIESIIGMTGREAIEKVSKSLVDYRDSIPDSYARCENCVFFSKGSCSVVVGDIEDDDVCDVFQPTSTNETYDIKDFERFVKGLMNTNKLALTVIGSVETPNGDLVVVEDGGGHRFSMYKDHLVAITASWHGWTDSEVLDVEAAGTN